MFVTTRVEIEAPIVVLLTVLRAGIPDYGVKWEIPDYIGFFLTGAMSIW